MKLKTIKFNYRVFFWFGLILAFSCSKDTNLISPIPDVIVREQLNLNSSEALPLKSRDGTFVYIKGGLKGIIVYRRSQDNFLAFERKSPYRLEDSCGIISGHSSYLYMIDSCHNCTFDWQGQPTGGPCKDIMKQYQVQYLNNFTLLITNP